MLSCFADQLSCEENPDVLKQGILSNGLRRIREECRGSEDFLAIDVDDVPFLADGHQPGSRYCCHVGHRCYSALVARLRARAETSLAHGRAGGRRTRPGRPSTSCRLWPERSKRGAGTRRWFPWTRAFPMGDTGGVRCPDYPVSGPYSEQCGPEPDGGAASGQAGGSGARRSADGLS